MYDTRRRGRVGAERGLLNELRIVANLSEADLDQLLEEPLNLQRKKVLGWRYWPQRALHYCAFALVLGVTTVVVMKIAESIGSQGSAPPTQPPNNSPPPNSGPSVVPPSTPEAEPEPAPDTSSSTNPDITSTSHVLRLASTSDIDRARMLARVTAELQLDGEALRPQIVHQGGLYRVIVGPYDRREAEILHGEARMLLFDRGLERRAGAVVQNMAQWCPRLGELRGDIRWCSTW